MNKFVAENYNVHKYSVPFKANQFGLLLFDFSTRLGETLYFCIYGVEVNILSFVQLTC